jgi:hypothetical protein
VMPATAVVRKWSGGGLLGCLIAWLSLIDLQLPIAELLLRSREREEQLERRLLIDWCLESKAECRGSKGGSTSTKTLIDNCWIPLSIKIKTRRLSGCCLLATTCTTVFFHCVILYYTTALVKNRYKICLSYNNFYKYRCNIN